MARIPLLLLPEGSLQPNDEKDDPLKFYYRPLVGALYRKRIEAGLALLQPPYQRILEIGYGSGLLFPTLCEIASEVCGVDATSDPEKTTRALARHGARVELFKGDVRHWQHPGEPFDLIVAFSILEHIDDPASVLRQLADSLGPGGSVLIGMPRVDKLMVPLFSMIGYPGIEDHHITTYRDVIEAASPVLRLRTIATFPAFLPPVLSLYYNMLFEKSS